MKSLLFSLIPFLLLSSVFANDDPDQTKDLALERSNEHTLAAIYKLESLEQDLDLYIGSAEDCHEVQICSIDGAKVKGDKFEATQCKGDKVIFRPIENTVKVGSASRFFGRPVARFTAKGKGKYTLIAQSDFDGYLDKEKNDDWETPVDVSFSEHVLIMSSGLSCPTRLRSMNYGFSNQRVLITDIAMTKPRAAIMSHNKRTPAIKGSKLEMKEAKEAECCYNGYTSYDNLVDDHSWGKAMHTAVSWQKYNLSFLEDGKINNPLYSFALEVKDKCRWVRICFDQHKAKEILCDYNSLDLLFEAGVFIPTDTEQATPFIAQDETSDLNHFVLEFSRSNMDSFITLKYGQVDERDDWFAVEHKMLSNDMLNSTLTVTLAAAPNCQAGLVRHMGNIGLNMANVERTVAYRQRVHIRKCECFTK